MRLPKLTSLALAAMCSVSFLTACSIGNNDNSDAGQPSTSKASYTHYVALGDSFAAMSSANHLAGPPDCIRSADNYPALVAENPRVANAVDVSCSSATTEHFSKSQFSNVPPQYEALTEDTDLVTISIGGNDIFFGDIIDCVRRTHESGHVVRQCSETEGEKVYSSLEKLPAKLSAMYAEVAALAPHARVITTGYMALIPEEQDSCTPAAAFTAADFSWALEVAKDINRVVKEATEKNGATFVLPENSSQHTGCATVDNRWTDFTGEETNSFPMHPTAAGHKAMAQAILDAL